MMWLYGFLMFAGGYCAAFVTVWTISWLEMDKTDAAMRRAGFIEREPGDWVHCTDPRYRAQIDCLGR
jgi:hypothetical protein